MSIETRSACLAVVSRGRQNTVMRDPHGFYTNRCTPNSTSKRKASCCNINLTVSAFAIPTSARQLGNRCDRSAKATSGSYWVSISERSSAGNTYVFGRAKPIPVGTFRCERSLWSAGHCLCGPASCAPSKLYRILVNRHHYTLFFAQRGARGGHRGFSYQAIRKQRSP